MPRINYEVKIVQDSSKNEGDSFDNGNKMFDMKND